MTDEHRDPEPAAESEPNRVSDRAADSAEESGAAAPPGTASPEVAAPELPPTGAYGPATGYGAGYGYGQPSGYGYPGGYGPAPEYGTTAAYPSGAGYGYPPGGSPYGPAPYPTPAQRRGRARLVVAGVVGAALVAAGGIAVGATAFAHHTTSGNGVAAAPGIPNPGGPNSAPNTGPGTNSGSSTSQQVATNTQQVGVVDIDTVLGYQRSAAAGTGLVMTSNGEILTNNHVIVGATSIKVTIVNSGRSYAATVVGTSPTQDVAVLQLQGASGLQTASFGNSSTVSVGSQVTGVGNAGGAGGVPSAAVGKVTALNQSITASNEGGGDTQHLTGLIETSAPIEPGDSGGPMYDSSDKVIGLNTAADQRQGTTTASYAIPINTARSIASQILSGQRSSTIHIGYPAFLGVSLSVRKTDAAHVTEVLQGGPAAQAGMAAGSVITAVGGHAVTSPDTLKTVLGGYQPGQSVSVTWTDAGGASHTATVTLVKGPAD